MKKGIATIIILLLLTGCSKCTKIETKIVKVKIVGEYYSIEKQLPSYSEVEAELKEIETYKIIVKYEGRKYSIAGKEVHDYYKNKIGKDAYGTLEIRTYENGQEAKIIIALDIAE